MYKARVEAVSGTKIFAGGKWLQCIGNKNFHVGELAWTDGRCAYGNHYTPQQPLVITAPQDEGIPILINESKPPYLPHFYLDTIRFSPTNSDYYTLSTKGKIKKVAGEKDAEYLFLLNDTIARTYTTNRFISYSRAVNDSTSSGRAYSELSTTLAANIDKQGNFYEIRQARRTYTGFNEFGSSYVTGYTEIVSIIKNGETLLEFDCEEYWNEIHTEVVTVALALNPDFNASYLPRIPSGQMHVPWGVIENENVWAFILSVYSYQGLETMVPIHEGTAPYSPWDYSTIHSYKCIMCAYLYTPNKIQKIWRGEKGYYDTYHYENSMIQEGSVYMPAEITAPQIDDHIPIQDGYYFKINSLRASAREYSPMDMGADSILPRFANISIFSPSDELLFTDEFAPGTYFTIYRGKFLGINDFGGLGLIGNDYFNSGRETVDIESGLYLIKDKKIEPILKGYICNWKLRPMKKIRGWQNRIRDLPTE